MFKRRLRQILHTLCTAHVTRCEALEIAHELHSMRRLRTALAADRLRAGDVYHARLGVQAEIDAEEREPVPAAG